MVLKFIPRTGKNHDIAVIIIIIIIMKKMEKEKRFSYFNPLFSMFKRLIDRDLYYLVIYFFANFCDRPYPQDYHKVYEVTYSVIDLYFMLLALINFQKNIYDRCSHCHMFSQFGTLLIMLGFTTRQALRVILCRLPGKRRKEIDFSLHTVIVVLSNLNQNFYWWYI